MTRSTPLLNNEQRETFVLTWNDCERFSDFVVTRTKIAVRFRTKARTFDKSQGVNFRFCPCHRRNIIGPDHTSARQQAHDILTITISYANPQVFGGPDGPSPWLEDHLQPSDQFSSMHCSCKLYSSCSHSFILSVWFLFCPLLFLAAFIL